MNIIRSNIADPKYDVLWEDISGLTQNASAKTVLIITNEYTAGGIEEIQLKKMLDACRLLPEQYNIITLKDGQMAAWHRMRDMLQPEIIFLIGIMPAQLGISALFQLHTANNFDGKTWLPTLSISELERQQEVKSQLWREGMRPLFIDNPLTSNL